MMSGLIVVPLFIFYLVVGTIVLKLILKYFNKKLNTFFVFLIILFLPFWDVILSRLIVKNIAYYTIAKPIIYEMPEKDKDGKIESIGGSLTAFLFYKTFKDENLIRQRLKERFPDGIENQVSQFVEMRTDIGSYKKHTTKRVFAKIYLNQLPSLPYEIVKTSQARYTFSFFDKGEGSFLFFTTHTRIVRIHDNKKNKIIAIAPVIAFDTLEFMNNFRNLFYIGMSGGDASQADILIKELFKIKGIK